MFGCGKSSVPTGSVQALCSRLLRFREVGEEERRGESRRSGRCAPNTFAPRDHSRPLSRVGDDRVCTKLSIFHFRNDLPRRVAFEGKACIIDKGHIGKLCVVPLIFLLLERRSNWVALQGSAAVSRCLLCALRLALCPANLRFPPKEQTWRQPRFDQTALSDSAEVLLSHVTHKSA